MWPTRNGQANICWWFIMTEFSLVPVDHQPDFSDTSLVPVDHDAFTADDMIGQARTQLTTQPERLPAAETHAVGVPMPGDIGGALPEAYAHVGRSNMPPGIRNLLGSSTLGIAGSAPDPKTPSGADAAQQVMCGANPGHCSVGQAVGAIGDGAYSSLEGVGNAARFVGRSIGLYGSDEINRSDREIRAAAEAVKDAGKLLMDSPEARSFAAHAAEDAAAAYWRDEKNRYFLLGRGGFGLLTDLGPVAMIGDATRALEKGHNAIDALGKGIVGNRQP